MRTLPSISFALAFAALFGVSRASAAIPDAEIAVIPKPAFLEPGQGYFLLGKGSAVTCDQADREVRKVADYFRSQLTTVSGLQLKFGDATTPPAKGQIRFVLLREATTPPEGYRLTVTPEAVELEAATPAGLFYGVQTLFQLLPPQALGTKKVSGVRWQIPCLIIKDAPRYGWRGMHLDVSRHFFPVAFVKRYIDHLATYKMNRFHWHLTDDQGWRIQILRYPKLTDVSAWRVDHEDVHWNVRTEQQPGEQATYGGFYTQAEIREVVRYAQERFITIVPEVEMPAHATAVLAAYPELSCTGGPFTVTAGGVWPITDIFCAGNDATFEFLQNVLTEVAGLFPGEFLHIGGDEADKTEWKRCPKCQARIKAESLANETELQSYFIKRIEKHLGTLNKRLIGWDEILEGGLAPNATVMSWRGINGAIHAARSGHDAVMSPTSFCYLDYYQGAPELEPVAIGGMLRLKSVYGYEPTPDSLSAEESKHILGVQGNLWAEYIQTPEKAEYMAFPRAAALAEVAWSPRDLRNWDDFLARLISHWPRFDARKVNAAKSIFSVSVADSFDVTSHAYVFALDAEVGPGLIHYTLDGSTPTRQSPSYAGPITVPKTAQLKAATFVGDSPAGQVTVRRFPLNPPGIASVSFAASPDRINGDPLSLVDNRRARWARNDVRWIGFQGKDMEATIDLGSSRPIRRITARFLHESQSMSFLPPEIVVAVSADGTTFADAARLRQESPLRADRSFVKEFDAALKKVSGRFVRIIARNAGPTPAWHKFAGQPSWLLVDEVSVE
jgi:hexosaminidase